MNLYILNLSKMEPSSLRKLFISRIFNMAEPILLYIIITLVMVCYPIGFDIAGKYLGINEVVMSSNYFWWFDYSTTYLHVNPLYDSYLFYPLGQDMMDCIFPLTLFIPITHIFGSVVSYNLYVLLSFIAAAYGAYLLSLYLLNDRYVAFTSGLIFAYSPFHFGAAFGGHLHILSIMWIPFFVLYFLKMHQEPTKSNILLSSLFFSINALTSWTFAVMASIFIVIYIIMNYKSLSGKKAIFNLIFFCIISIITVSPGLYLMIKNYLYNKYMVFTLSSFTRSSADILGFLIPSPFHPFFGAASKSLYSNFTGNTSDYIVFMGYSVIILSLIGMINCRKERSLLPFIISLFVFFILSMGPRLHINGQSEFALMNTKFFIPLPGLITAYLPIFDMIRYPSRFDIMVMFCIAIIAGYGLKSLFIRYKINVYNKVAVSILLSLIILFEFATVLPTQSVKLIPNFYHNASHGDYSIIEIPIIRSDLDSPLGRPMRQYYEYQKIHQEKLLGGYFNRIIPIYAQFAKTDPVLSFLYTGNRDIYNDSIPNKLSYLGEKYNVKYIVLHKSLIKQNTLSKFMQYLGDSFEFDNSVKTDPLVIYSNNFVERIRN